MKKAKDKLVTVNKDIIQSYILSTAKYDFSVHEKRILYRLVEAMQAELQGQQLKGLRITKTLYDDREVYMPISCFLKDGEDQNYAVVKKALLALRNKTLIYNDGQGVFHILGIIEKPRFSEKGWVRFDLTPPIYDAILNFAKGHRKYELKTAMEFSSVYSMRFYELLSEQVAPISYSIDKLKNFFCVKDKYKETKDFIRRVIEQAKKELDEKSPYSFSYKLNKTGRKYTSITFFPIYQPQHRDYDLERKDLQKQVSLSWDLQSNIIDYLKHNFEFTTAEIKLK